MADGGSEQLAVVAPDATLTYGDLVQLSNRLATKLAGRHVGRETIVALVASRSAAFAVGALAIMKVGATYLPIDPDYPAERIQFILADSGASLVVVGDEFDASLYPEFESIAVDVRSETADEDVIFTEPTDRDVSSRSTGEPAYVVYTSGSTGQPKGAIVSHAGLTNLVHWHIDAFNLGPRDRTTQFASTGFDACAWEVWPTLAAGATLHVVPDEFRTDPRALRDWLVAHEISVSFAPTIMAEALINLSWPADSALRFLLTGGGPLSRFPPSGLPFDLVNNFGLSEATVVSTSGLVRPQTQGGTPTIGREIDGVAIYILDDQMQPVETGGAGELCVGGVSVALGYLNRPELTADRFVADPGGAGRLYRSGDLVRRRPDGEIEFLGRLDEQMSIRGFRVEPGEVAAALLRHPEVLSCCISGDQDCERCGFTAHLVAAGAAQPADGELRSHLASTLPDYMIPSRFAWMDRLPLGPHGKVDRTALHAGCAVGGTGDPSGAWTPTEAIVASILRELLGQDDIGRDADFFLLGGHSMLAAELLMRIESACGVQLTLLTVFDGPSIAEIASAVDQAAASLPAR